MSHTIHEAKGQHKQSAIIRNAADYHEQVAVAAYFRAEHRGFNGGDPVADWLAAEAEIDSALNHGKDAGSH